MTTELKEYISSFIDMTESKDSFNYMFNLDSELETYKMEFSKFINLYNCFFFSNGRLLFVFNSYEIILKQEDIEQLLKLYLYSKKLQNKDYLLISEFIISYYTTIKNKEYRQKVNDYKEIYENYQNTLIKFREIDKPYVTFINNVFDFYNLTIQYCIENNIFINLNLF